MMVIILHRVRFFSFRLKLLSTRIQIVKILIRLILRKKVKNNRIHFFCSAAFQQLLTSSCEKADRSLSSHPGAISLMSGAPGNVQVKSRGSVAHPSAVTDNFRTQGAGPPPPPVRPPHLARTIFQIGAVARARILRLHRRGVAGSCGDRRRRPGSASGRPGPAGVAAPRR